MGAVAQLLGGEVRARKLVVHLAHCVHQFWPGAPKGYLKEVPAVAGGRGSYPDQAGALVVQRLGGHDPHEDLSASHPVAKVPDNWGNDDHHPGRDLVEPEGLQALMVTAPLEALHDVFAPVDHVSTQRDLGASGDQVADHLEGHQTVYGRYREVAVDLLVDLANRPPLEDDHRDTLGHGMAHLRVVS